jgi:hypothetical protein
MLKEQQVSQQAMTTTIVTNNSKLASLKTLKTAPLTINLSSLGPVKANAPSAATTTTLKRPFIVMAVFFMFGLNIFQFM